MKLNKALVNATVVDAAIVLWTAYRIENDRWALKNRVEGTSRLAEIYHDFAPSALYSPPWQIEVAGRPASTGISTQLQV